MRTQFPLCELAIRILVNCFLFNILNVNILADFVFIVIVRILKFNVLA